jgi:threonine/homoserine/homoserine lactone efflux protein
VAASAGISFGGMVHVGLAGLGLGAVVAALPWALEVIRWIGVAYLLWLTAQTLRHSRAAKDNARAFGVWQAFRTGFYVNLSNPKVILFVLAFVPQFVRPDAGSVLGQFLVFGAVLGLGGFVINAGVGVFASTLGRRLARGGRLLGYLSAGIFVALAARLAMMERA